MLNRHQNNEKYAELEPLRMETLEFPFSSATKVPKVLVLVFCAMEIEAGIRFYSHKDHVFTHETGKQTKKYNVLLTHQCFYGSEVIALTRTQSERLHAARRWDEG
ncbi:hypothetical protein AAFF_G00371320 [Aldrovandia affinis]|uniref:Uncharacterized protein n=1 Tax=Aldrovandia affinis TaxID=143900 RepID=A0AAD7WMF4_9TELE|nr:hypothetical protein AAFF_G00371320 [Aldrovandia affinis]